MDSLIVLRRPLRKTQLEPRLIIPKKSKKVLPKLGPIPSGHNSNEPTISFVKLYKDVCVENAKRATCVHAHSPTRLRMNLLQFVYEASPTRVHTNQPSRENLHQPSREQLNLEWLHEELPATRGHVNSPATCSATSLVTQYGGRYAARRRVCGDLPPSCAARAEFILELDYDTGSRDSGFC